MIIITIMGLINQRYFILSTSYFNHYQFLMRQLHPTIISSYTSASLQLHCHLLRSFCHLYTEERGSTQ